LHNDTEGTGFGTFEQEGLPAESKSKYQSRLWTVIALSSNVTRLLQRMRNVKKFYWNHIHDCRVSTEQVPVIRLHSSRIQPLPLKMKKTLRLGQNHRHNSHQTHSGNCPLAYRRGQYTHLQGAPGERMTMKHHSSMTALLHFVFSCCILHSLS